MQSHLQRETKGSAASLRAWRDSLRHGSSREEVGCSPRHCWEPTAPPALPRIPPAAVGLGRGGKGCPQDHGGGFISLLHDSLVLQEPPHSSSVKWWDRWYQQCQAPNILPSWLRKDGTRQQLGLSADGMDKRVRRGLKDSKAAQSRRRPPRSQRAVQRRGRGREPVGGRTLAAVWGQDHAAAWGGCSSATFSAPFQPKPLCANGRQALGPGWGVTWWRLQPRDKGKTKQYRRPDARCAWENPGAWERIRAGSAYTDRPTGQGTRSCKYPHTRQGAAHGEFSSFHKYFSWGGRKAQFLLLLGTAAFSPSDTDL